METAVVCDFHDSNKGECIARLDMHLPGPWLGANTDDNRYKEDDFLVVFSRKGETNIKVADFWPGVPLILRERNWVSDRWPAAQELTKETDGQTRPNADITIAMRKCLTSMIQENFARRLQDASRKGKSLNLSAEIADTVFDGFSLHSTPSHLQRFLISSTKT